MLVTRHDAEGVATLTLDRPDKLNAINIPLMVDLRRHVDDVAKDDSVGCVVLLSTSPSMSAFSRLALPLCQNRYCRRAPMLPTLPSRHIDRYATGKAST